MNPATVNELYCSYSLSDSASSTLRSNQVIDPFSVMFILSVIEMIEFDSQVSIAKPDEFHALDRAAAHQVTGGETISAAPSIRGWSAATELGVGESV